MRILKINKYILTEYTSKRITKEALIKLEKFINIFLHVFTEETLKHKPVKKDFSTVLIKVIFCCFNRDKCVKKVNFKETLDLDERVKNLLYRVKFEENLKLIDSELRNDIANIYIFYYANTYIIDDMLMLIFNIIDSILNKADDIIDVKKLSEIYNSIYGLKILDEYMGGFNILSH